MDNFERLGKERQDKSARDRAEKIFRDYFPDYIPKDGKHNLHSADLVFAIFLGIISGRENPFEEIDNG